MKHKILITSCVLLFSGCISQSDIQAKYVSNQKDCRFETGRWLASREELTGASDPKTASVAFNECMTKTGWRVAQPKPNPQMAQNPPTGAPSTNPSAATGARINPAENPPAGAGQGQSVQQQPNALATAQTNHPPSGSPSTNPVAAASTRQAEPAPVAPVAKTAPVAATAPAAQAAPAAAAPVAATAPVAQVAPTAKTAPVAQAAQTQAVATSGGAVAPVRRAATPSAVQGVARYRPARPAGIQPAPYGTGAGRNF